MTIQSLPTRRSQDITYMTVDFTPYIASIDGNSTATAASASAIVVTGVDSNPTAILGNTTYNPSLQSTYGQILVNLTIANGVSGTIYQVTCRVTMSTGNVYSINLYQAVNDNAI